MGKKVFSWISFFMIAALLLPACTVPFATTERKPLRIEYTQWEGDYTLLIAHQKGFFTKHGVEVEPVYYPVFSHAVPDMAAKRIDGGLFSLNDLLNTSLITDVKAVAVYDSGGPTFVVARKEIRSTANLKGKKIGALPGTNGEQGVREMLTSENIGFSDITFVAVDPENVTEKLNSGEIDAGLVWAPFHQKALAAGYKIIYSRADAYATPDVIVIHEDIVKERPEDVRAFLAAWFEALDYRLAHPEESNQIISRLAYLPLNEVVVSGDMQLYSLSDNLKLFDRDSSGSGSIYHAADANLQFLITTGLVTFAPELEKVLDPSFLK